MGMLAKIRRMYYREHLSIRGIARRTGLSRNTVRDWLRQSQVVEPEYAKREVLTKLDAYVELLSGWLTTNRHRGKRERRTVLSMYQELTAMGYRGGYGRMAAFARRFIAEESMRGSGRAFVPLKFQLGEAFQFDWIPSMRSSGACAGGWTWRTPSCARAAPSPLSAASPSAAFTTT